MKFIGPILAAATVVALALPAAASPSFDAFRRVCGDTHADFAAIKSALGAATWGPTEVAPTNMEGVTPDESIARTTTVGDARVTIFAWVGTRGAYHVTACTARVTKLPVDGAARETQGWLGFAAQSADAGKSTWRYSDTAGGHAGVDKAGYEAAAAAGGLFFLNVFADHGEAVLDLLKIKS